MPGEPQKLPPNTACVLSNCPKCGRGFTSDDGNPPRCRDCGVPIPFTPMHAVAAPIVVHDPKPRLES